MTYIIRSSDNTSGISKNRLSKSLSKMPNNSKRPTHLISTLTNN